MPAPIYLIRPSIRCFRCARQLIRATSFSNRNRNLTTSSPKEDEAPTQPTVRSPKVLDPTLVSTRRQELELLKTGVQPIGSRRRRAALQIPNSVPFEQLPYQCFQEARKIIAADREDKIKKIEQERKRIANVKAMDASQCGGEASKKGRLVRMQKYLHHLKILADSNDPTIKKRFEDGQGDMNRPIYRHFADRQWRQYRRLLLMQRITQMHIVPDILPHLDPIAEVTLGFGRRIIKPGEFVDSRTSELLARLKIQVFDKGERLVNIVIVDPDVPNEEKDSFDYRCHYLAVNVPVSPTTTSVPLSRIKDKAILSWLPPFAQKGAPYHRLAVFILEQREGKALDPEALTKKVRRDRFNLRAFNDRYGLKPVGFHLFRSKWDEGTADVMARAGIAGAEVVFHRKKSEKLPYKKKDGERYR